MLNSIRRQAGSWVVKVLLMLLVASFAVWGIGDIFYGGERNPVIAEVGDSEIPASELTNEFNRLLSNVERRIGTSLDRQQAIQFGLMQQALQDLIARRLIDLRAQDMGLVVSDETLRRLTMENPAFQTAGRFDRSRFHQLLLANGMSEDTYLATLRQDVLRSTLTDSLVGPVKAPAPMVETLYRHRNEQRRGRLLRVAAGAITDLPEPSQEDLAAFHESHAQQFTAPEYRRVTFVTLLPEDMLEEIEVSDEEVEATYQERIGSYRTAERRNVEQLLAADQAVIEEAASRVADGNSFEAVAGDLADQGATLSPLGEVTQDELPRALAGPVFALEEGAVSEPVQSAFGWHLLRVSEVQPEEVTPLAEVQDEIRQELALQQAGARLPSLADALDDELAAGQSLEEAASAVRLEVQRVEVDRQGQSPAGERPDLLPEAPEFLEIAFETPAAETSLLEETGEGGYFVLHVDEVQAPHLRPLDEVREEVIAGWRDEKRLELARMRAEELLEQMKQGTSLEEVASSAGIELTAVGPIRRNVQGSQQGLTPAAVRALFSTDAGDFADQAVQVAGGFALIATDEVIGANPADDPEAVTRLRSELEAEMQADILAEFEAALRRAYSVSINTAELQRLGGEEQFPGGATTSLF